MAGGLEPDVTAVCPRQLLPHADRSAKASVAASLAGKNMRRMFFMLQQSAIHTKLMKWKEYQVKYDKKNDILIKKRKMW